MYKSDKELIEELKIAQEIKALSQFEIIKRYNDYTDKETEAEMVQIESEIVKVEIVDPALDNNDNNDKDS
jgi:hypothetical protein